MTDPSPECRPTPEVYLALGVHDHQPVGNFDWVFREHYQTAYRPFLDVIEDHPAVPFSLHLSGPLLLWLAEAEPRFLSRLRTLVQMGRVEVKAGGFYEPILALIPEADAHEQLRRMRCFVEEQLGTLPTGVWPAERVWEPHLARVLADAGLEYAVLDDSHFRAAGVRPELSHGYFVTEEQGRRFDLFPISKELRYLIPFREPGDTLELLRRVAERWRGERAAGGLAPEGPPPLLVYDDDGEKFGGWPGTHAHVYGAGWLDRFLTAVEEAASAGWLGLVTLEAFRRRFPPLGRVYLPTASYAEMLEWSGGFFRNFLVRYDEANLLHKRMLYTGERVRRRLARLGCTPGRPGRQPDGVGPGESHDALSAYDHVLRAQCNDAYWHGIFGGLYLPHLRDGVTRNLLRAEALLKTAAGPPVELLDLDLDGREEVLMRTDDLVAIVAPSRGGTVIALDHLPSGYALLNTLRRRREPEHAALERLAARASEAGEATGEALSPDHSVGGATPAHTIHETVSMKEPGLELLLFEDRLPRTGFIDRFLRSGTTDEGLLAELVSASADELGDLALGEYSVEVPRHDRPEMTMRRSGSVAGCVVSVEKTVSLVERPNRQDTAPPSNACLARVGYRVAVGDRDADAPDRVRFAPEITINLLAGWDPDRYMLIDGSRPARSALADTGVHPGATRADLVDEQADLSVSLSWNARLHMAPIASATDPGTAAVATLYRYGVVTVSQSEDGFERVYQGTALAPAWELPLVPGTVLTADIRLEVDQPLTLPTSTGRPQPPTDPLSLDA